MSHGLRYQYLNSTELRINQIYRRNKRLLSLFNPQTYVRMFGAEGSRKEMFFYYIRGVWYEGGGYGKDTARINMKASSRFQIYP